MKTGGREAAAREIAAVPRLAVALLMLVLLSACSTLSVDAAKELGTSGKEVATAGSENIFATDDEYRRAMDAEAALHGFAGQPVPEELKQLYQEIQDELRARRVVFKRLAAAYDAFGELADIDAAAGMETALKGLGDAVAQYKQATKGSAAPTDGQSDAIGVVGGMIAAEVQKAKIMESSKRIRESLSRFLAAFEDPLVHEQITSFRESLAADRGAAVKLLWWKGVFDAAPLLDSLGADVGLKASKDSAKSLVDPAVSGAMLGVITCRLEYRVSLIQSGYEATVAAIRDLIDQHKQFEAGNGMSLEALRAQVAQLQRITDALTPADSADSSTKSN